MTRQSSGFVAGTLIHTKNGLVPIEEIKVGDWVLSQPEQKGELAYKRVVKTFTFEDRGVYLVRYQSAATRVVDQVAVTGEHPFCVVGRGWLPVKQFGPDDVIQLHDGTEATVFCRAPIRRTNNPRQGWVETALGIDNDDGSGYVVNFNDRSITVEETPSFNWEIFDNDDDSTWDLRARVFNLEVEDFHTYCVGELGVLSRS